MSVFTYAIEVWACAYGSKYLSKIDKFCKRAWKYGYTKDRIVIDNVILTRDKQLFLYLWNYSNEFFKTKCLNLHNV